MNHESGQMVKRIAVEFRVFIDAVYTVDSCSKSWKADDFGKTVFLSRETAEAAKKEVR